MLTLKKLKIILLIISVFLFFSCSDSPSSSENQQNGQIKAKKDESDDKKTDEPGEQPEQKAFVKLQNNSQFKVNVYSDSFREDLLCTIEKSSSIDVEATEADGENIYYLTYLVDIGAEVPWGDNDDNPFIVAFASKTCPINDPQSMKVTSCFVIIENQSTEQIIFKRGSSELAPDNNKSKTILSNDEKGVYKIGKNSFGNFDVFKILTPKGNEIPFPENFVSFESGKIFTIVVSNENTNTQIATIKSVSPFDLDTKRQIWTAYVNSAYSVDCVRSAYNVSDGSFYVGGDKSKKNAFFIEAFDVYGKVKIHKDYALSYSGNENVLGCSVIDAFQNSGGDYVLLIQLKLGETESAFYSIYYLFKTNESGSDKKLFDLTAAVQKLGLENVWFYGNLCKGGICEISNKDCGIFCSAWKSETESDTRMYYFAASVDFSKASTESGEFEKTWKSEAYSDLGNGVYRSFTSACLIENDFFVCGYDNFNADYSQPQHKGVVYKISSDFSSAEEIYSSPKCLFFGIVGKGGDYYACGETMGNSGDGNLYGGFLSSKMIKENSDCSPVKYASTKGNTWFTQISLAYKGLALCGINSATMDGTGDTEGILTCFSEDGKKLWENEYSDYPKIVSMCMNSIGTQILHLKIDAVDRIVSTNLLGVETK